MNKVYVGDLRNDCFFIYLRNKSVLTLSQNLQIFPICIVQADSKVLELKFDCKHWTSLLSAAKWGWGCTPRAKSDTYDCLVLLGTLLTYHAKIC